MRNSDKKKSSFSSMRVKYTKPDYDKYKNIGKSSLLDIKPNKSRDDDIRISSAYSPLIKATNIVNSNNYVNRQDSYTNRNNFPNLSSVKNLLVTESNNKYSFDRNNYKVVNKKIRLENNLVNIHPSGKSK